LAAFVAVAFLLAVLFRTFPDARDLAPFCAFGRFFFAPFCLVTLRLVDVR
jgi:hypothetical protein